MQAGDTLNSIATRFGVTIKDLMKLNDIANADQVYVGQVLRLTANAATSAPATSSASERKYTVQRGDTLYSIATRLGVTTADLAKANNLANPNQIYTGQVLIVP